MIDLTKMLPRTLAEKIPGSPAQIAKAKRIMQRELRAQGYSRSHADHITWRKFNDERA